MSLARSFCELHDRNAEALEEINNMLGTRYSLHRLGEWRNGRRTIPRNVRDYMLEVVLVDLLGAYMETPIKDRQAIQNIMDAIR